ncbi:MAG: DUF4430 domain-containing protein [Clostridia bacterium]|nr:DUF4430 domain-containing protein [Clostridia bacterium]
MKMTNTKQLLSFFLCIVLIAAMALFTTACNDQNEGGEETSEPKSFTFIVVDGDGKETSFDITSSKKTVGEALLDEGLIEGEDGAYGLYVKKVNGILAEYETTGTYWAFYVNGEYGLTGVDTTDIVDGETYSFKVEKA